MNMRVLLGIIIVGIILGFLPIEPAIKRIVVGIVVVFACIWALRMFFPGALR